ncbi:MAG: putative quinol monooxygenase [Gordonia sp. (in: high G+C Gram-positive bacteria)]
MPAVIVVATVSPKPGAEETVKAALLAAVDKVHAEPGCERYALHQATDSADLVFVEKWESAEALAVHSTAPALAELGAALGGLLSGPLDVRTFTALPGGDPAKGAL